MEDAMSKAPTKGAISATDTATDRRGFLKSIGGASVAGAAVAVGAAPVEAAEDDAGKKKARYQETDHVKAYYRTNRY
jgi:anaerobic selenocysteine-containing dehydrogenase